MTIRRRTRILAAAALALAATPLAGAAAFLALDRAYPLPPIADPEISYGGIVTLVDALNAPDLLDDPHLGPQVAQQIRVADLVLVTKTGEPEPALMERLAGIGRPPVVLGQAPLAPLLFGMVPLPGGKLRVGHPAYVSWSHSSDQPVSREALGALLERRPAGLYRLKGFVLTEDGGYELHVVGQYVEARRAKAERTVLVGLGPAARISAGEIEEWWAGR